MVWDILANLMFFLLFAVGFGGFLGLISGYFSIAIMGMFLMTIHIGLETQHEFFTPITYLSLVAISIAIGVFSYQLFFSPSGGPAQ